MAIAAMLAELCGDILPVWIAFVIALVPVLIFVFVHPGEFPGWFVGVTHTAASMWYVAVAIGLLVALFGAAKPLPRGWPVYPVFVAIGAVPCGIVLYRCARGKYPPPVESVGSGPESGSSKEGGRDVGS